MISLFLLLGCNLSYNVDLFAALHELASTSMRTLLKLASSVRALLKPYGDTLMRVLVTGNIELIFEFRFCLNQWENSGLFIPLLP